MIIIPYRRINIFVNKRFWSNLGYIILHMDGHMDYYGYPQQTMMAWMQTVRMEQPVLNYEEENILLCQIKMQFIILFVTATPYLEIRNKLASWSSLGYIL